MCFLPAGVFGNPLAPFLLPLPPQKGEGGGAKRRRVWVFGNPLAPLKGGWRKAAQGLGLEGSRPVGWQPVGVPLLRGSGVSETIFQTGCLVGQRPAGVFKMSSKCFSKTPLACLQNVR